MPWRRRALGLAATSGLLGLGGVLAGVSPALAAPPGNPAPAALPAAGGPPSGLAGRVTLYLPDAFFVHHQAATVPRRWFHVVGIVRPYVAGEAVTVEARLGGRLVKTQTLVPAPSANRTYAHFKVRLQAPASGRLSVTAAHAASPRLGGFQAQRSLDVLDEHVGFGSTGRFVQLIQQRLAALHLYIPQTGVYDAGTGWAIDAYHRLLRWGTSQRLDGRTISFLLDGFGSFRVRFPTHRRHAEGNLSLQLLALVNGGRVDAIYPISSGKPSTPTILGDFHVYSKVAGYLPDGMYYSNFFIRGYAIHGYDPAPDYPASHGCMRLPISDAISAYDWLKIGDWVDVYY